MRPLLVWIVCHRLEMPVGTYVTRQMKGVQREGNCLTDHFLALRREYHHPLIWIICQSPESSHRVCTVTFVAIHCSPVACIACHVRGRLFSPPNADTFVRWPPPHYDTFGFIFACWWPGGTLDLVRCGKGVSRKRALQ